MRRASGSATPLLTCGDVQLDPGRRQVRFGGRAVTLTTREFAILHALLLGKGRVLSKAQLEEQLYGWGEEVGSNTVEVFIHHLRRKLAPGLIRTVRGVGYLIEDMPS
ncbi:winged helix-turn-helix domain-containing protein [Thauera aromatica]|uniref:winged helix-turn-helix domain-containing protein n=1 Tax=Thauera aromatica TaxID=59405 RepID=UPI003D7E8BB4